MATTIQIKRSTGTSAPSSLAAGELAVTFGTGTQSNLGDRLFIGDGSTVDVIGGKFFSDMLDHTHGTLTASSALTVDSNSALDDLNIGNHATTGGSIQLKEGTNNGAHHVQLKAPNSLGGNVSFTLPNGDGNANEVLKTNGSGTLSFGGLAFSQVTGTATLAQIDIDGGTDIGADLVDADLMIVDDGAGGTNRKSTLTRLKKYIFSSVSGDATASNTGTFTLAGTSVTNAMLAGSIANSKLANSAVQFGSTLVSLGGASTSIAGVTELDVDNVNINGNTISTTNSNGNIVLDPNGTGTVDVSGARISNLAAPTNVTDAATKAYVDAQLQGLEVKNSVRVATTANGTLASAFANNSTVDGVTLATNDRILLKNQSTGSENGIYTVNASGAPTRAFDFDADSEVTGGTFFFVEEGTVNADNGFVLTNDGSITVGSTALTFTQFSGAGQVIAGDAITKSGNTLNVGVDDSSIEVNSDALRVKASGITNAMLAGSIDLTAKVTGALPIGNGGIGITAAPKGSVLVANSANTISALDGGGSNDGILTYTASSDTIAFATAVDGGTFS